MKKFLISLFIVLLIFGISGNVLADSLIFNDFSSTSGLFLNGNAVTAHTIDGDVLRLTPALADHYGSAFSSSKINMSGFSTFFSFRITEPGGILFDDNTKPGADGIVFVIQTVSPSAIGGAGGGIGYSGISPSIGVEFDTWHNSALYDPSSNHLGMNINGTVNHGSGSLYTADVNPDFDDGSIWYSWIDYDGSVLEVRVNQTGIRPETASLSMTIDIGSILGDPNAFVGFTSGTGADWGNHDIISWYCRDEYKPIDNIYCEGDFDLDGDVDGSDLAVFAGDFERTDCYEPDVAPCEGDFDHDGDVDGSDLALFAEDFGRSDCPISQD